MKKLRISLIIASLIILIGSYYLFFNTKEAEVSYYEVKTDIYTESIVATGNIEYDNLIELKSEVPGTIKDILAEDGDSLSKGEELILIDNSDANLRLKELKANQKNIETNSLSIKSEYNKAMERLKQSELIQENLKDKYKKNLKLFKEGAISEEKLDQLEKELKLQESIIKIDKENVNLYSNNGAKYKEYIASLEEIKIRIETAEKELKKYSIGVPFDAVILEAKVSKGEYIQNGTTLALIAKDNKKYAEVAINEEKIPQIYKGQKAYIFPEGYKSNIIEGVVAYISPTVDEDNGTVKVKVLIEEDKDYLANKLTVKTEFILEKFSDAIIIPANYILKENENYYVILYNQGKGEKKEIKIYKDSITSNSIKVEEGLNKNDIIINPEDYEKESKVKLSKGDE